MKEIIIKYLEGRASEVEQLELLLWLRKRENRKVFNSQKLDWKNSLDKEQLPVGSENSWSIIQDQLLKKSFGRWQNSRKLNMFFRVAAIFFFVISVGSAIYLMAHQEKINPEFFTNVVAENGQISKVKLPDGSLVWLNSGSVIKYNNNFAVTNRAISLSGEAYFQVTKNKELPLVVNSGELQIKVLGTKFNVSAYPELDKIEVVLESGRVDIFNSEVEGFHYRLNPGELAAFNNGQRKLHVSSVNTVKYTSWKEGMIHIYNQTMKELTGRLEKRYNQKFDYDESLKDFHFSFTIENESLDEIIYVMKKIAPIKAIQKDDIIEFKLDEKRKNTIKLR